MLSARYTRRFDPSAQSRREDDSNSRVEYNDAQQVVEMSLCFSHAGSALKFMPPADEEHPQTESSI